MDNLAIEPILGLLPESVLSQLPVIGDGAAVLGEESVTNFSGENLEFMETIG